MLSCVLRQTCFRNTYKPADITSNKSDKSDYLGRLRKNDGGMSLIILLAEKRKAVSRRRAIMVYILSLCQLVVTDK